MRKRILLLSMPNYTVGFDRAARLPNLGLCSIAGNIDEDMIDDIGIVDLVTVRSDIRKYIIELLTRFHPHIVGLSAMSFQYQTAVEIGKIIKSMADDIITVFGGYHVTLDYESVSKSEDAGYIDYIIRGEGEVAFNKLVRALVEGTDKFSEIENLSYKDDGAFVHNSRSDNLDLHQVRLPKRDIRLTDKYLTFGKKADVIETSRGCTMACNFCCMPFMYGRTVRKYRMDRVVQDITRAIANGAESLSIVDDNPYLDNQHMHDVCDAIIENELDRVDYSIQASVHGIASDEDLVKKMAKAGFKLVYLGIENVNREDIEFLSKDEKVLAESERAVRLLQENGMLVAGGFIVGLPEDSEESIWDNFHFAKKMNLDVPIFFVITPYIKTAVRQNLMDQSLVTNPDDYCFYDGLQANVKTKSLSSEQISYILLQMYSKYYDLDYLRHNRIKEIYPLFFWRNVIKEIPKALWRIPKRTILPNSKLSGYLASRKRLIKRLDGWLLGREKSIPDRLSELAFIREN